MLLPTPVMDTRPARDRPADEPVVLDEKLARLRENARRFARESIATKRSWLGAARQALLRQDERWVQAACAQRHVDPASSACGELWLAGPGITARYVRLLQESLAAVEAHGHLPLQLLGETTEGELRVRVTPTDWADRVCFPQILAESRMKPHIEARDVGSNQATFYHQQDPEGGVALVLGGGNVDSIAPMDALCKMFVEGKCCIVKLHPVNEYLGPILEEVFSPLVEQGYLAFVNGGAAVGKYLAEHESVDCVHLTGSEQTHAAIVWGAGEEAIARRKRGSPRIVKPVTSELGGASPVLITPGDYTPDEMEWIAQGIVGGFVNNAASNCNANKVLVTAREWHGREPLLARVRRLLQQQAPRHAFYPGVRERYEALVHSGHRVEMFGAVETTELPWALVTGVPAGDFASYMSVEPFCPVLSEATLPGADPVGFLRDATRFANNRVPGTLCCTLYVSPRFGQDSALSSALNAALVQLRYGTVTVNTWSALGYGLGTTPWGGAPGGTLAEPESGIGWVHNSPMLESIDKCVVWGVLRGIAKPVWYPSHRAQAELGRHFSKWESRGGAFDLLALAYHALRG